MAAAWLGPLPVGAEVRRLDGDPLNDRADNLAYWKPRGSQGRPCRSSSPRGSRRRGDHRTRASDRDALAERLHTALVAATGRLADPTDLTAAVGELLTRKPHLASRRPSGDVGQGATAAGGDVDLAGMLRARA